LPFITTLLAGGDLALAMALNVGGFARLWHVPNEAGTSEENLFKKAKGQLYYFLLVPRFYFFKAQVVLKSFICPRGKSLIGICQPFCLKPNLSDPMAGNVCV